MPTNQENFTEIFQAVNKFLGVADPNYPEGGTVAKNAPYTEKFLKKRLVQADVEIVLLICSVTDHPYRTAFFTTPPTAINANTRIPAFMGTHGGVEIQTNLSAAAPEEEVWKDGDLAQSFDHLKSARNKAKINKVRYGENKTLYWIENGKIELIRPDLKARVYVPIIPKQNAETEVNLQLYTPFEYRHAALAKCLSQLRMKNTDSAFVADWMEIWRDYEARIYGKALNLPQPERLQRIAA